MSGRHSLRSPWLPRLLFRLLVPGNAAEHVLGDIEEEYPQIVARRGPAAAGRWYWRNALHSIRAIRRDRHLARHRIESLSPVLAMENTLRSIRFAVRTWLRQPTVTLVALATITLGIGANSAIFSVVHGVLLNPLPYPEPDELMTLWLDNRMQGWHQDVTSFPGFVDWRDWNETFDDMAAISFRSANVTGSADPERIPEAVVSRAFFEVLAVSPSLGRGFSAADWDTDERLIVISQRFWQQRYGAEPGVLGSSLVVNGDPHTIVGVMPAGFQYMRQNVQFWRLFAPDVRESSRGQLWLEVVGRLSRGVTLEQARADMNRVGLRLEEEYPDFNTGYGVTVVPVHEQIVGDVRPALLVLLGAVGLVLLIACANVANLMLARASSREREIAIRSAIGATRAHLFHQLLVESVLLALIGGLSGLGLARSSVGLLRQLELDLPRIAEIGLHPMVLLFTLTVSLLTGLLFGVFPALQGSHARLAGSLKGRGTGGSGARARRFRQGLVAGELALALVLLVGAGLLIRSYATLVQTTPGFQAENLLVFRVSLSGPSYQSGEDAIGFFAPLLERLEALPGVEAVAGVRSLPMSGSYASGFFTIQGRPPVSRDQLQEVKMNVVTAGYFETMGVPVRSGRTFEASDIFNAEPVVVINDAFARTWFPNEDPVGQRFLYGIPDNYSSPEDPNPQLPWLRIVGVVGGTRQRRLETEPEPEVFGVFSQARRGTLYLALRTQGEPTSVAAAARAAVWALDPDLPVSELDAMSDLIGRSTAARRFNLTLLALFAGLAVALAAIGIYGVIAYWVSQQRREIGVRMALGARRTDVLRMIMRQTALVVAAGVVVGLVAAFGLTRLMTSLLYGVGAADPLTFVLVALSLAAIAMGASFVPAQRATRIDPNEALRQD